jgi:hypothetical protein
MGWIPLSLLSGVLVGRSRLRFHSVLQLLRAQTGGSRGRNLLILPLAEYSHAWQCQSELFSWQATLADETKVYVQPLARGSQASFY